jgi:hypothetical protein
LSKMRHTSRTQEVADRIRTASPLATVGPRSCAARPKKGAM